MSIEINLTEVLLEGSILGAVVALFVRVSKVIELVYMKRYKADITKEHLKQIEYLYDKLVEIDLKDHIKTTKDMAEGQKMATYLVEKLFKN